MDCPFCNEWAGHAWGQTGNPESSTYYICGYCGAAFYYTYDGVLKKWDEKERKWLESKAMEMVIFT
jgi:hypothetical protein